MFRDRFMVRVMVRVRVGVGLRLLTVVLERVKNSTNAPIESNRP